MDKFIMVHYSELFNHPSNPRVILDAGALTESIVAEGLKDKIEVCDRVRGGGHYAVIGNRRLRCLIDHVRVQHPERFEELFPEGNIEVKDHGQLSEKEQALLIVDHGNTRGLSGHGELYLASKLLLGTGLNEQEVVGRMASLLNLASPIKSAKAIEEIRALQDKVDVAVKAGDAQAIKQASKELAKRNFSARRGQIQLYNQLSQLPKIVEASLMLKWTGDVAKGFKKDDLLMALTAGQVGSLYSAFLKDCDSGFSKTNMGPEFKESWRTARNKIEDKPEKDQTKAMSSGAIKEPVSKGQIESEALKQVILHHGGKTDIPASCVADADKLLAIVECIKEHDEMLWVSCEEIYEEKQAEKLSAELSSEDNDVPTGEVEESEEA